MITFSRFGKKGRLGNQLFHLAGMIGLAKKLGQELRMPTWSYGRYFQAHHTMFAPTIKGFKDIEEDPFHYVPEQWDPIVKGNWDVSAWLQTEKYWDHCMGDIKEALKWDRHFEGSVLNGIDIKDFSNTIAISVRRGDYVNNRNYDLLPVSYYMQALMQEFPDWMDRQIMIFSDDIPYCKIHFSGLPNVWFAEGYNDIVQLCIMSQCAGHVIANSTFSWWGAYLAELRDPAVKIVRPAYLFDGPLKQKSDSRDHWPERWTVYDHKDESGNPKKYDLRDVTFTIPVMYDHMDRRQNLNLNLCLLQRVFDANYIIGEGITHDFEAMIPYCQLYVHFEMDRFHRTRMLNEMAILAKTPIIANWDADVCVPEVQTLVAVELIRKDRADGVYPYDGRFARVPRKDWFGPLERELDLGIYKDARFKGTRGLVDRSSVGGAVIWNKAKFFEAGGENEHFISHAPEDAERWERYRFLGYRIARVEGQLFHMDHWVGPNSSNHHGYREHNGKVWAEVRAILDGGDKAKMWEYIKSWPWYRKLFCEEVKQGTASNGIEI